MHPLIEVVVITARARIQRIFMDSPYGCMYTRRKVYLRPVQDCATYSINPRRITSVNVSPLPAAFATAAAFKSSGIRSEVIGVFG